MPTSSAAASASPRSLAADQELPAWIDGRRVEEDELVVDATDPGLLRGDGVFEVVRRYAGVALAMPQHLDRLRRSAQSLELDYDANALARECVRACSDLAADDGYLRIVITRMGTRLLIAEPALQFPPTMTLIPVDHAVSPLVSGVKSLSYAANCRAKRNAEQAGADDALLVDPVDRILELPFASFGAVIDGALTMPPLELGILDSVTRRILAEAFEVAVRPFTVGELAAATEACVVGTGMEVCPVTDVAGVVSPDPAGPVVAAAAAALRGAIKARLVDEKLFRSSQARKEMSNGGT